MAKRALEVSQQKRRDTRDRGEPHTACFQSWLNRDSQLGNAEATVTGGVA